MQNEDLICPLIIILEQKNILTRIKLECLCENKSTINQKELIFADLTFAPSCTFFLKTEYRIKEGEKPKNLEEP